MYESWAAARGMGLDRLPSGDTGRHLFAVGGLGCWRILGPEAGLHVLEHTAADGERSADRETVRVTVAARDTTPAPDGTPLDQLARAALTAAASPNVVVRRYRTGPSPLVRDSARGYRTGHLEQVLAGDFDLY
jgi:ATP-dependent Clp protease ATP-binding subunit ClpC